jgi:3,4-dihydroxy 2-butanone 4-phosphate synthase/GTP cyclohydrolase II
MNSPTIPFIPRTTPATISPIEEIIADIRQGKMVVLMDDEDRENEGDLMMAADAVDASAINFMAMHARGLICLTLTEARCRQLELPLMVRKNRASLATNFTISIEAAEGVTTGISTADRARTVQAAVTKDAQPGDIVRPGHIFPLMAQQGGVLARAGHTEAGCDLARLGAREPAAVICEIMNDDGTMARLPDLLKFADKHGLKVGTIADLIEYRHRNERLVAFEDRRYISTLYGSFEMVSYRNLTSEQTHVALICGEPNPDRATLVRVHAPINNFDLLDNKRHGHTWSVAEAMRHIQEAGEGVLLLLKGDEQDWQAQVQGERHFDEEYQLRHYGIGAQILKELGIGRMRLMTWPRKLPSMSGFGLSVEEYVLPEALNGHVVAE